MLFLIANSCGSHQASVKWLGAFGSFVGIDEFASFQVPFESQFNGWSGGFSNNGMTKHFTRYGDGTGLGLSGVPILWTLL